MSEDGEQKNRIEVFDSCHVCCHMVAPMEYPLEIRAEVYLNFAVFEFDKLYNCPIFGPSSMPTVDETSYRRNQTASVLRLHSAFTAVNCSIYDHLASG